MNRAVDPPVLSRLVLLVNERSFIDCGGVEWVLDRSHAIHQDLSPAPWAAESAR